MQASSGYDPLAAPVETSGRAAEGSIKISQRPSKSCTECIRRKTRCNKQIPCETCLKRDVGHLCKLESQYMMPISPGHEVSSASASYPTHPYPRPGPIGVSEIEALRRRVDEELSTLRNRVAHLERQLPIQPHPPAQAQVEVEDGSASASASASPGRLTDEGKGEGEGEGAIGEGAIATTLEFFALGMDRRMGAGEKGLEGVSEGEGDGGARRANGARVQSVRAGRASLAPSRLASPAESMAATPQHTSHILAEQWDRPIPESIIETLLPRANVHAILLFAEAQGLWQHCCVFFPYFWIEVDQFWATLARKDIGVEAARWRMVDPAWIALFFVLQGIAVHQMTDEDVVKCGLQEELADRFVLPNALISAAEDALYTAQFLSRPTVWTVQAITILCLCGHNVCESEFLHSLLAIGIKTAQTLNLHSLGKAAADIAAGRITDKARIVEVELGRRLWWGLAQEDWFGIPFRGVWSIHPGHFDTPLPSNAHDQDLQAGINTSHPDHILTVVYKTRFSSNVASTLQQLFHSLSTSSPQNRFAAAESAAAQIRHLLTTLPLPLHANTPSTPSTPPWILSMRHYIHTSATHKLLVIYRAFLARGGTSHERNLAHAACVQAAETIIAELERGSKEVGAMQALWTIPYHSLAAAVVLALDMISLSSRGSTKDDGKRRRRREWVERARRELERLSPTSRIARRGLQVLADLFKEAEALGRSKRKGEATMARIVKRIKLPSDDVVPTPTPSLEIEGDADVAVQTPSTVPPFIQAWPAPQSVPAAVVPELVPDFDIDFSPPWNFDFSNIDTEQLLANLQETVPDVGRLFDGTIGNFGYM